MKIEGNNVFFRSGRKGYAYKGIIGIGHKNDEVTGGYDQHLYISEEEYSDDNLFKLTKDEKIELADYMVERWRSFKDSII